jgi:hypothetical protein
LNCDVSQWRACYECRVVSATPRHPKSKYLVVKAGHKDTPNVAREQVVAWLKGL